MECKNTSLRGILYLVLTLCLARTVEAKSVYAIINHAQDIIAAYEIDNNSISFQIEHTVPTYGSRVVDVTSDPGSEFLFVTYEGEN